MLAPGCSMGPLAAMCWGLGCQGQGRFICPGEGHWLGSASQFPWWIHPAPGSMGAGLGRTSPDTHALRMHGPVFKSQSPNQCDTAAGNPAEAERRNRKDGTTEPPAPRAWAMVEAQGADAACAASRSGGKGEGRDCWTLRVTLPTISGWSQWGNRGSSGHWLRNRNETGQGMNGIYQPSRIVRNHGNNQYQS